MQTPQTIKRTLTATTALTVLLSAGSGGMASALAATGSAVASSTGSTATAKDNQTRLAVIIAAGDREIGRRLTTLGTLTSKITAASKLSSGNKTTLSAEVSSETSGLTALKTKLDAETTAAGAKTDAQGIYTDYRVYALVVPKVELIKVADDQQVTEGLLRAEATKLQTQITADQTNGKDVTSLQAQLADMTAKTQAAAAISTSTQATVINLQASDYDSNHAVLSGDNDQLKTAHTDDAAAYTDAQSIVAALKNL